MFSKLNGEINSILERDPAAKSKLEVVLCYPGFHAVLTYRFTNWMWRKGLRLFPRWLSQISRFFTGIEIHPAATIGKNFFIDHGMGVVIGETATIGDNVTIYHGVTLGGVSAKPGKRHPQVGNDVIIGSGAQVLGPISVGNGARIGSNAVVVRDVPESATMVGVPARNVSKDCTKGDKFSAYGISEELPDVVMRNFEEMDKVIRELTKRLADLEAGGEETAKKWDVR